MEAAQNVGYVSDKPVRLQRAYPLAAVVGMDHIKQALLLGSVDTGSSGGPQGIWRMGAAAAAAARRNHPVTPPRASANCPGLAQGSPQPTVCSYRRRRRYCHLWSPRHGQVDYGTRRARPAAPH